MLKPRSPAGLARLPAGDQALPDYTSKDSKMPESRYNFWGQTPDGASLLFNGRTGALLELEDGEDTLVRAALAGAENEAAPLLRQSGCVVDDSDDEVNALIRRFEGASGASPILELTLSPTYACNFRCTYCYVDFDERRMSEDVARRIRQFFERELPGFEQANITWFGGEPLLQWRQVAKLASDLSAIGRSVGRPVLHFLTTNGYLLTPEVARTLVDSGISYFHVTIDGADQGQDTRRVLRGGHPTYERVLANLLNLLGDHPEVGVTLRMNLEPDSTRAVRPLLESIPLEYRHRVQVHATPIIREGVERPAELHRKVAEAITLAQQLGYAYYDNAVPIGRSRNCSAEASTNYQIGPDGQLHKCSPSFKPEVTVGRLGPSGAVSTMHAALRWKSVPQLADKCLDCRYLCFCGGGCRLNRLRVAPDPTCADQYGPMDTLILNRWLALKSP